MRYDIYYILKQWAPNLTQNKIYASIIEEIVPSKTTFEVKEIEKDNKKIQLDNTDLCEKSISVVHHDQNNQNQEMIKFFVESSSQENRGIKMTTSEVISPAHDSNEEMLYSYIEKIETKKGIYYQATTTRIGMGEDGSLIFSDLKFEKQAYDKNQEKDISGRSVHIVHHATAFPDYVQELRSFKNSLLDETYLMPDFYVSFDGNLVLNTETEYAIKNPTSSDYIYINKEDFYPNPSLKDHKYFVLHDIQDHVLPIPDITDRVEEILGLPNNTLYKKLKKNGDDYRTCIERYSASAIASELRNEKTRGKILIKKENESESNTADNK